MHQMLFPDFAAATFHRGIIRYWREYYIIFAISIMWQWSWRLDIMIDTMRVGAEDIIVWSRLANCASKRVNMMA